MRITAIEARPVNIALRMPFGYAGVTLAALPYCLISIATDEGQTGFGEAALAQDITGETQASVGANLGLLRTVLVGMPLECIDDAAEAMTQLSLALACNRALKWAIEMALLDCIGQAAGKPVAALFAAMPKTTIAATAVMPYLPSTEAAAAFARDALTTGYHELKIKVGRSLDQDVATIKTVVAATPGLRLCIDANQGWVDADTAISTLRALARFDLLWVEQPVAAADLDGLKRVKQAAIMPVMADESMHTPADCRLLCQQEAVDLVNIKPAKCGGMFEALKIAALCRQNGMPFILGAMIESTLGMAANVHLAAVLDYRATEINSLPFIGRDIATGLMVQGSHIAVPQAPGLGVRVNDEARMSGVA